MSTIQSNFPPFRSDLKETFGYLSFQCGLINMDVVGIRMLKSYEVIAILWRGNRKCGWIYEGEKFTAAQLLQVYNDVPENKNDLEAYEERFADRIELLEPPKDNYIFVTEKSVEPINKRKYDSISKEKAAQDIQDLSRAVPT